MFIGQDDESSAHERWRRRLSPPAPPLGWCGTRPGSVPGDRAPWRAAGGQPQVLLQDRVRRLGVEVDVVDERVALTLEDRGNPGAGVGEAPDRERDALADEQAGLEH